MTRLTSPRFAISYPDPALRDEPADVPGDIEDLVLGIEKAVIHLQGTFAARPAASIAGRYYRTTDTKQSFYDTGSVWELVSSDVITGTILPWPYSEASVPAGWALCYGQTVSRAANPLLNAIASASAYPHGNGDGSTTFNLPDMRGRIPAGKDNMGGTAANRISAGNSGLILGGTNGAQSHSLGFNEVAAHNHTVNNHNHGAGVHNHNITDTGHFHQFAANHVVLVNHGGSNNGITGLANWGGGTQSALGENKVTGITVNNSGGVINLEAPGTNNGNGTIGDAHNNLQPGLIVNWIIKIG